MWKKCFLYTFVTYLYINLSEKKTLKVLEAGYALMRWFFSLGVAITSFFIVIYRFCAILGVMKAQLWIRIITGKETGNPKLSTGVSLSTNDWPSFQSVTPCSPWLKLTQTNNHCHTWLSCRLLPPKHVACSRRTCVRCVLTRPLMLHQTSHNTQLQVCALLLRLEDFGKWWGSRRGGVSLIPRCSRLGKPPWTHTRPEPHSAFHQAAV